MRFDESGRIHTLEEDIRTGWRRHGLQPIEETVTPCKGKETAAVWTVKAKQVKTKTDETQSMADDIRTVWRGHGWKVTDEKAAPCEGEESTVVWTVRAEQIRENTTKPKK